MPGRLGDGRDRAWSPRPSRACRGFPRARARALLPAFPGRKISALARRPHEWATSYALEELRVSLDDGSAVDLMFKDLAWERLLEVAAQTKPHFLYEPRRSIEIHRRVLDPAGIGPRCYAAIADPHRGRYWLVLERVPGFRL